MSKSQRYRRELQRAVDPTVPQPVILLYRRTTDVVSAQLELAQRQLDAATSVESDQGEPYRERLQLATERLEELRGSVARILKGEQIGLNQLLSDARQLQADVDDLVAQMWQRLGIDPDETDEQRLQDTLQATEQLLAAPNS